MYDGFVTIVCRSSPVRRTCNPRCVTNTKNQGVALMVSGRPEVERGCVLWLAAFHVGNQIAEVFGLLGQIGHRAGGGGHGVEGLLGAVVDFNN